MCEGGKRMMAIKIGDAVNGVTPMNPEDYNIPAVNIPATIRIEFELSKGFPNSAIGIPGRYEVAISSAGRMTLTAPDGKVEEWVKVVK